MPNQAVVIFGSNIDPERNIARARSLVESRFGIEAESETIRTKPVGAPNQPCFLNGAWKITVNMDLTSFQNALKTIERRTGRLPEQSGEQARVIDLDVVLWNKEIIHKDYEQRKFVRQLVSEVCPHL